MQIEGAGALVTGGASGLGEATVRLLGRRAGAVVTIVDRNAELGKQLAADIGGQARFAEADVADPEQVQAAVDHASDGVPLRFAINCAGIGWAQRTIDRNNNPADLAPFEFVVRVNLIGTFNVTRLAAARIGQSAAARPTVSVAPSSTPRRLRRSTVRSGRRRTRHRRAGSSA